jgi:hypothetical protein
LRPFSSYSHATVLSSSLLNMLDVVNSKLALPIIVTVDIIQ